MTRIEEIRARLAAATPGTLPAETPADLAYLLAELERVEGERDAAARHLADIARALEGHRHGEDCSRYLHDECGESDGTWWCEQGESTVDCCALECDCGLDAIRKIAEAGDGSAYADLCRERAKRSKAERERDAADAALRAQSAQLAAALADVARLVPVADAEAVAAERERCARVCECVAAKHVPWSPSHAAALCCREAIRRGGGL